MDGFKKSQNVVICENCGKIVKSTNKTCPYCSKPLYIVAPDDQSDEDDKQKSVPEAVPCPICGSKNTKNQHCFDCGYDFDDEDETQDAEAEEEVAPVTVESSPKRTSGFKIFLAVVLGILAAIWLASQIFEVRITGTIMPVK